MTPATVAKLADLQEQMVGIECRLANFEVGTGALLLARDEMKEEILELIKAVIKAEIIAELRAGVVVDALDAAEPLIDHIEPGHGSPSFRSSTAPDSFQSSRPAGSSSAGSPDDRCQMCGVGRLDHVPTLQNPDGCPPFEG